MDRDECRSALELALAFCQSGADDVQSVVSSFGRLKDELDDAYVGPASVGETYGAIEIRELMRFVEKTHNEIGSWLRLQGIVALVSSVEVFLEEVLKICLRSDSQRLKMFLERMPSKSHQARWKVGLKDLAEVVGQEVSFEEWLVQKTLGGVIFHRFEWVDDLYEVAFDFRLFDIVDREVKGRLFAYRDLRHEILHGIEGGPQWSGVNTDEYLERAVNDVLVFSQAVFDNVFEALGLE